MTRTKVSLVSQLDPIVYGQLLALNDGAEGLMRGELSYAWEEHPWDTEADRFVAYIPNCAGYVQSWALLAEGPELWFYTRPELRNQGLARRCARQLLKIEPNAGAVADGRNVIESARRQTQKPEKLAL